MATYASKGDRLIDGTIPPRAISPVGSANDATANASAGLSAFWGDCPLTAIMTDPGAGYMFSDGFEDLGLGGTITTIISNAGTGKYLVFGGAGSTIVPDAALGGGITLTLTDDNQATSITTKQTPFQIESSKGSLWFEARVKTSTITTNEQAWFVGLMDTTPQTATVPLEADGDIATINSVGFHHPEANTTAFDAFYKANDVTLEEVNSDIGVLEVGVYVKLGFKFDSSNNVLSYYVNGVLQAAGKTVGVAAGTDFPDDVTLAPVLAILAATDDTETFTCDWWKTVQAR